MFWLKILAKKTWKTWCGQNILTLEEGHAHTGRMSIVLSHTPNKCQICSYRFVHTSSVKYTIWIAARQAGNPKIRPGKAERTAKKTHRKMGDIGKELPSLPPQRMWHVRDVMKSSRDVSHLEPRGPGALAKWKWEANSLVLRPRRRLTTFVGASFPTVTHFMAELSLEGIPFSSPLQSVWRRAPTNMLRLPR